MGTCKNCCREQCKNYRLNNKEKRLKCCKNWRLNNKEKISKYKIKYNQNHKKVILQYKKNYEFWRRQNDLVYRLRCNISCDINAGLKKQNARKNCPTWSKLSYSPKDLKEHLESRFDQNMSWENYGSYWQIDHIYPQSKLPYNSMDHPNFLKCWGLENLRPLSCEENARKGNNIINV